MVTFASRAGRRPFYGWRIVAAVCVTLGILLPFRFWVFGIFLKSITEDLGWSRTALGGAYSVSMLLGSALGPMVGRLVDRHGPRAVMTAGALICAASLGLMAFLTEVWQIYVLFGVVYTVGESLVGFVPTSSTISRWFVRRRGIALGIVSMMSSAGSLILMPATGSIIAWLGWRAGFVFLALLVLAAIPATVWLIMRKSPEEMGLLPDGEPIPPRPVEDPAARVDRTEPAERWRPSAAARTLAFWIPAVSTGVATGAALAVSVHFVAFSADLGYSQDVTTTMVLFLLVVGLPARFLLGWLADVLDKRLVMALYQTALVISLVLFTQARSMPLFYLAGVFYGVACGGFQSVPAALAAELFGRRFIGSILGYQQVISTAFAATAIFFSDYSSDVTGSYIPAFYLAALALAAITTLAPLARPPRARSIVMPTCKAIE